MKTCLECKEISTLFGVSGYTAGFTAVDVDSCLDVFDDNIEMVFNIHLRLEICNIVADNSGCSSTVEYHKIYIFKDINIYRTLYI